jgi:hypothetical protein
MWLEEIENDKNIWNKISILRAAVVVVGKILNDGAVDVVAVGANENVPAVVGFVTEKPNDVPAAVVAAGNNEVEPEEDKSTNQMSFFFQIEIYQNQNLVQLLLLWLPEVDYLRM